MKIGLDVRLILHSGIGTTIRGLLDHWTEDQKKQTTLLASPHFQNTFGAPAVESPFPVYSLSQHLGYAKFIARQNLDLYHMPHFDVPLGYRRPFVATVHDLIHFIFPQFSNRPFSRLYSKILLSHVSRNASRIITVSENTRKDLIRFFPAAEKKTAVLYPAVDKSFQPVSGPELGKVLGHYGLKPGYVLNIGNLRASKNTLFLLGAYSEWRKRRKDAPELVLAGQNSYPQYHKKGFPEGVRYLGVVEKVHLAALYSGSGFFVFPSLYEGFGLPPLEAMACGAPVIASNAASLPEVCGEAAEFIDPRSQESLIKAFDRLWTSSSIRESLRQKGFANVKRFSWTEFAQRTWTIYESCVR